MQNYTVLYKTIQSITIKQIPIENKAIQYNII